MEFLKNNPWFTALWGFIVSICPATPKEGLIFVSTILGVIQIIHWIWRLKQWIKTKKTYI